MPEPTGSGTALAVSGLTVAYGAHAPVLRDVDISVEPGEVVALLGANGAGKSTLVRAISGLLPNQSGRIVRGTVRLFGADVTNAPAATLVRVGLAQSMEGRRVFSQLSVEDNLLAGAISRRDRREVKPDLDGVFQRFPELASRKGSKSGFLSGGQQQMLAIGRALMARPRLLVLDEPSLGLAPQIVRRVFDVVEDINREGTTVLLIEQNVAMALEAAHRAFVLETGRVVAGGSTDELAADERVRAAYLGGKAEEAH